MPDTAAVVVAPATGETLEGPAGGPPAFKVRGEQTDGALAAFENVAPGDGPPLRFHAQEAILVLAEDDTTSLPSAPSWTRAGACSE